MVSYLWVCSRGIQIWVALSTIEYKLFSNLRTKHGIDWSKLWSQNCSSLDSKKQKFFFIEENLDKILCFVFFVFYFCYSFYTINIFPGYFISQNLIFAIAKIVNSSFWHSKTDTQFLGIQIIQNTQLNELNELRIVVRTCHWYKALFCSYSNYPKRLWSVS